MQTHEVLSQSPAGLDEDVNREKSTPNRRRLVVTVAASSVLFIVIALGLGLGLGLGLRHSHSSENSSSTSTPTSSPTASPVATNPPLGNQAWKRNPADYILGMDNWDLNAPPTTRAFSFDLSQIQAYPDG